MRPERRQATWPKAPLPETALAEELWGACDPSQTKDYWNHPSGEIKRHQEKNPPFLAKALAPVRLVAAAPPLREASAGGWRRARGQAHINGNENPHTLYTAQWKLWAGLWFLSAHLFSLHSTRSGFHRAKEKKILLAPIQASPSAVNTLLPELVCRGDCKAVFTHLWYIISMLLGKQPCPRGALAA